MRKGSRRRRSPRRGPIGDFGEVRVQPPGRGGAHPRVFPQCPDDAVAGEAAPVDIAPGCAPGEHDGGAVRAEAAGDFVAAPLELEGSLRAGDIDVLEGGEVRFTGEVVHADRLPRYEARRRHRPRRRSWPPRSLQAHRDTRGLPHCVPFWHLPDTPARPVPHRRRPWRPSRCTRGSTRSRRGSSRRAP